MTILNEYSTFLSHVKEASPQLAIVLGSGLSKLLNDVKIIFECPYTAIPEIPRSTVTGHQGLFILAECQSVPVLFCSGRLHYYEGWNWHQVTSIVRQVAEMGIQKLLLTNAAGGIHSDLAPGDIMLITRDLDFVHDHHWQDHANRVSPMPDDSPYSTSFWMMIQSIAEKYVGPLFEGTYACMTGPSYETPAEILALRQWGADAVGMSTTQEARLADTFSMSVGAISFITNKAAGLSESALSHEEVLETATQKSDRLVELVRRIIVKMRGEESG